jgi:prepilin-type N-terminal cleavage/methylation domain-containing protein
MRKPDAREQGFTLAEILIALGIFSVAVSGLLVLFPVAQRTEREGTEEARAALIAESISGAFLLTGEDGRIPMATGNGMSGWRYLDPEEPSECSVLYGYSCEPIAEIGKSEAELPVTLDGAASLATLRLRHKPTLPGLVEVEISVASPASAPAGGRSVRRFVRLLPMPHHG